jgi:hypothetical protein
VAVRCSFGSIAPEILLCARALLLNLECARVAVMMRQSHQPSGSRPGPGTGVPERILATVVRLVTIVSQVIGELDDFS